MKSRLLPNLAIVAVAALLGLSVAKVSSEDPLVFSLGAAVVAAVAVVLASLFRQPSAAFEQSIPPRKLLGLRIGVTGFLVALFGWLLGVFWSASVGYAVVVVGIVFVFVGFPIHIYNMFRT